MDTLLNKGVMNMSRGKSFFLGMLVGGAIGSAVVLLTSPSSGKELRDRIQLNRQKLDDLLNELKTEGSHLKEQITNTAKESIEIVKEVTSDLNKSIQVWKKDIDPHKQAIQQELKEIEAKIKELEESISSK